MPPQLGALLQSARGLLPALSAFINRRMTVLLGRKRFCVAKPRLIGVTQPVIPKQVSGLEQRLGDRLVHRSTLTVALTEEGREVIRSARQLLDATTDIRMRHKRADDAYE